MNKKHIIFLSFVLLVIALPFLSCKKENGKELSIVTDAPELPATPYEYGSSVLMVGNDSRTTLGRVLFYDKNLSLNNTISCGSCHKQERAFCDNKKVSSGLTDINTSRNTPSIFGRPGGPMFWDGRALSLEDLALMPVLNHVEMRMPSAATLVEKLKTIGYYPELFSKAFGSTEITETKIRSALADFLLHMNFSNNKFAKSLNNLEPLNGIEEAGRQLFFGKAGCSSCHDLIGGMGYGGVSLHHIGLDEVYLDKGKGAQTGWSDFDGQFVTPVLLNVDLTAPYMHDGRFNTLEEVIEHYNSGVVSSLNLSTELRDGSIPNGMTEEQFFKWLDKNGNDEIEKEEIALLPVKRLNLSEYEKKALVSFLKTLTDPSILSDIRFSNPFIKK